MNEPTAYLSTSHGLWRLISHAAPLCKDGTRAEAEAAAAQFKIKLPAVIWNGDRAEWVHSDSFTD